MAPSTTTKTLLKAPECDSDDGLVPRYRIESSIISSQTKNDSIDNEGNYLRAWEKKMGFQTQLIWKNIIIISLIHIVSFVWSGYNLVIGYYPKWQSIVFTFVVGTVAGFGVTAGVHRYWCHHSYKATLPLQWILLICYSAAGQNTIYEWVRDHRIHHKYFNVCKLTFCFVLPTLVPPLAWGESWDNAILSQMLMRYVISLNFTWAVNSFAHLWGNKPYNPDIMPTENWGVSLVAMGEGWHNYHHTFPWDYRAAELSYSLNITTLLLDGFAKLGWAHHLKEASPQLVQTRNDREWFLSDVIFLLPNCSGSKGVRVVGGRPGSGVRTRQYQATRRRECSSTPHGSPAAPRWAPSSANAMSLCFRCNKS
ncbi:hypothetical protein MSG28_012530 [Choristoneura fumiferana]|uniref:Uncharacterized protein n=1 Tax=Choristoneura fumiferana TaxID=7141 RepID=A0ACC0KDZ8_CHOFU|nr:hypothetical protein MSG28_012530 [Choristoneura fumiferana]